MTLKTWQTDAFYNKDCTGLTNCTCKPMLSSRVTFSRPSVLQEKQERPIKDSVYKQCCGFFPQKVSLCYLNFKNYDFYKYFGGKGEERLHYSDVAVCKDQILLSKSPINLYNFREKAWKYDLDMWKHQYFCSSSCFLSGLVENQPHETM